MRETRNAQASLLDFYSGHDTGKQLKALSDVLDQHPGILVLLEQDFSKHDVASTGARGLSVGKHLSVLDTQADTERQLSQARVRAQ